MIEQAERVESRLNRAAIERFRESHLAAHRLHDPFFDRRPGGFRADGRGGATGKRERRSDMPARLLDGRALAADLYRDLAPRCAALAAAGRPPRLVVVLVGDDPASRAYARTIERLGATLGCATEIAALPVETTTTELRRALAAVGARPEVDGVLLQQPLPPHLRIVDVADALPPEKDVDAATPANQGRLAFAGAAPFIPATAAAVLRLLERSAAWPLGGRDATVVGRSTVVGLPVSLLLGARGATVTIVHKETRDIARFLREAEVVVAAAGVPRLIPGAWLRPGSTVIDVGTSLIDGALVGDVAEDAREVAGELTPVPGGVGPATNAALLENLVTAAERSLAVSSS